MNYIFRMYLFPPPLLLSVPLPRKKLERVS